MDYYEDQKPEAARRAATFREDRIPKYAGWFERLLVRAEGDWIGGRIWSTADLSLFHVVDGLLFAFPRRMKALAHKYPRLLALHQRVSKLPELKDHLHSDRRLPHGDGIFRHYPELDGD